MLRIRIRPNSPKSCSSRISASVRVATDARGQVELRGSIRVNEGEIERRARLLAATEAAIARRSDTHGDRFAMVVQGTPIAKRPEAETRLKTILAGMVDARDVPDGAPVVIARMGGFDVSATVRRRLTELPGLGGLKSACSGAGLAPA